jgi:hypothetical protein
VIYFVAISHQPSAISHQPSAISQRLPAEQVDEYIKEVYPAPETVH